MIEIKELSKVFTLSRKMMKEAKVKSNKKIAVDHLALLQTKVKFTVFSGRMAQAKQQHFVVFPRL